MVVHLVGHQCHARHEAAGFAEGGELQAADDGVTAPTQAPGTVFATRGLAMPEETARGDTLEVLTARGRQLMEQLHGDRVAQGYATPGNTVTGALYPLAVQYG
jgi:hypothetical protein